MIEVVAATQVAASAETAWAVLTELDDYDDWNPFIRHARGSLEVGGEVHLRVRPRMLLPLAFNATITGRTEQRELRWHGHFGSEWLASGDHRFVIEPIDDHHCRFVQCETFGGALPQLAANLLEHEAKRGFEMMNRELAARAERLERIRG